MNLPTIAELLPHDGPMILLDRVLSAGADDLCAEVGIRADTLFCDGAGVGSWIGIEYMAQAIAAHSGFQAHLLGSEVEVGFLLGARRYVCGRGTFALGSVLHVFVHRALQGDNGLSAFECRIEDAANGEVVATATVTVYLPKNLNEYLQRGAQ
ncbi:ApeP family dehydratase [Massilia glaciei]|uniref:3-hydroxylacyl-ACP dehydratase n=1 Tax=Massilia glaciei TaxID=1524097 RepID=A0A2U2HE53_9BURK|nr:hotdog family protein [Massilia glaciei]PWF41555.1 3-hydroxylacyl-ACP dehydratase [Massilia glaciei]